MLFLLACVVAKVFADRELSSLLSSYASFAFFEEHIKYEAV
jgi:ribonuclease HII